jgi:predicted nucleic acid-binding protein
MTTLVVDTSVGVKWVVPESDSDAAERLRGPGFVLHAPAFFLIEAASVLWKKHRRGELSPTDANDCLTILERSPITWHPDAGVIRAAFDIALRSNRSVYDSLYLALAIQLQACVVTADEKLRNGLRGTVWEQLILWVEDIP